MDYNREEREIDLIDAFYHILKKWRVILCWMIIGLLIASAIGYIRSASNANATTPGTKESINAAEKKLTDAKTNMSAREITETELAVESYLSYRSLYDSLLDYNENALIMKLDFRSVPTLTSSYLIDDYYKVVYPEISGIDSINNIIELYTRNLGDDDTLSEIAQAVGDDAVGGFVSDLYTVSKKGNSILSIIVTAPSREQCGIIMDILSAKLESAVPDVQKSIPHTITYNDTAFSNSMNRDILTRQQSQIDALINIENSMIRTKVNLSTNQQSYFTVLADFRTSNVSENAAAAEDVPVSADTATPPSVPVFSLKYALLGLFAGALLTICWYFFRYVISTDIKTKEEIASLFQLRVLGYFKENRKYAGIDALIERLFHGKETPLSEAERLDMICTDILISTRKSGACSVYLTGTAGSDNANAYMEKIADILKKTAPELKVDFGGSINHDPVSLKKMSVSESTVLVEVIGTSRYTELAKELELCRESGTHVIGAVAVY
ncbi:MAG: hypothetical protein IJ600_05510 [Lachnospiraceae bacterium]|nr:hypothetical protein [Lachnospiraceae bacterium]